MKLMMFVELGSTGAEEISLFHKSSAGNGTNPLRLVSCPTVIPPHAPACPRADPGMIRIRLRRATTRLLFPIGLLFEREPLWSQRWARPVAAIGEKIEDSAPRRSPQLN